MLHPACIPARRGSRRIASLAAVAGLCLAVLLSAASPAVSQTARQAKGATWEFDHVGLKGILYPSLMLNIAKMKLEMQTKDNELGDPAGLFGVTVTAPRAGARAEVEIASSLPLVNPGRAEVTLSKKGNDYTVFPFLTYPEVITLVHQPQQVVLTARLRLDGELMGEKSAKVTIASINDCVHSFWDDDDFYDTDWLYAAYVNEDHPVVGDLLREALATGETPSFSGYRTDERGVLRQVKAVWKALQRRGIRYASVNKASAAHKDVGVQHVRLLHEALSGRQANCVEGSCLLASCFVKIGLETTLVALPEHMLVGVMLGPGGSRPLFLETTMLSDDTFEEAAESGAEQVREAMSKARKAAERKKTGRADDENEEEIGFIDIRAVRKAGVKPIPDHEAVRARAQQAR